jgi:hypothetical protein
VVTHKQEDILMKLFLALALALGPVAALADGMAKLNFIGSMASLELEMKGDVITGFMSNIGGNLGGKVELKKVNGKWTGHLGMYRVTAGAPIMTNDKKGKINMTVLPGGLHTFHMKLKGEELQVNALLQGGMHMNGGLLDKGDELVVSNNFVSMAIDEKDAGQFRGTTMIRHFNGYEYIPTELNSAGDLAPRTLAKEDRALFMLIYMLPLNLHN